MGLPQINNASYYGVTPGWIYGDLGRGMTIQRRASLETIDESDYEGDDMTDVEIELRYDWAYLSTSAPGTQGSSGFFEPGSAG